MIHTQEISLFSEGDFYAVNITGRVREVVASSGIGEGRVLVYYRHTTGAVMIVEHEAGILVDLEDALEAIVPTAADYKHHLRGYDNNGAAHVRTALLNVSVTIPIQGGDLLLGTYQEILVIDMDPGHKTRNIIIQVSGQ